MSIRVSSRDSLHGFSCFDESIFPLEGCVETLPGGPDAGLSFEGRLVSELAVGGLGAVLAEVVVFGNVHRNPGIGRTEEGAAEGETGNVLEDVRMLDGIGWGFAPGEGGMASDKNAGDGEGVQVFRLETPDNDRAGIAHVGLVDFLGGERFGDGDRSVEVVGVGGAEAGNGAASLCPRGGELGVRVDDTADLGELAVEQGMGVEVAGGAEGAFYDVAIEIGDDQVGRGHGRVVDAAWLDDDQGLLAIGACRAAM